MSNIPVEVKLQSVRTKKTKYQTEKATQIPIEEEATGEDNYYFARGFFRSPEKKENARDSNYLGCGQEIPEREEEMAQCQDNLHCPQGVNKLVSNMRALLISKEFADAVLKANGGEFHVHRCVLGAWSSIFLAELKQQKKNHIVDMTGFSSETVRDFVDFLYSGEVEMTTSKVQGLYAISNRYGVKELKENCMDFMIKEISIHTFCDFITSALRNNEPLLLKVGKDFFIRNGEAIISVPDSKWVPFLRKYTEEGNELIKAAWK